MTKIGEAEQVAVYFRYLDELRDSGSANMSGAAPYLAAEFGMERAEASKVCAAWRKTYDPQQTPKARAIVAVSAQLSNVIELPRIIEERY